MNKNDFINNAICTIYEFSNNSNIYMLGILMDDFEIQERMKKLAHIQSIIIQSLQVNNQKRSLKYLLAFYALLKDNAFIEERLRESVTAKLIATI